MLCPPSAAAQRATSPARQGSSQPASPPQPSKLSSMIQSFIAFFAASLRMILAMSLPYGLPLSHSLSQEADRAGEASQWKAYLDCVIDSLQIELAYYGPFVALILSHFLVNISDPVSLALLQASLTWVMFSVIHSKVLLGCCVAASSPNQSARWKKWAGQLSTSKLPLINPLYIFTLPSLCSATAVTYFILAWVNISVLSGNAGQPPGISYPLCRACRALLIFNLIIGMSSLSAVVIIWRRYLFTPKDNMV